MLHKYLLTVITSFHLLILVPKYMIRPMSVQGAQGIYIIHWEQFSHPAHDKVGRKICPRDGGPLIKGSSCFASSQYASKRLKDWTATFGPGPKKPQRL